MLKSATLLKRRIQQRCFPVNFVKLLEQILYRTPSMAASVAQLWLAHLVIRFVCIGKMIVDTRVQIYPFLVRNFNNKISHQIFKQNEIDIISYKVSHKCMRYD